MADETPFPIVGLGASAGGIEALESVFRAMPADLGMGFVVIAHLAPGRESLMPEILQRFTAMPVEEVRDGAPVEPNRVYVIQAETSLALEHGRFKVRPTVGALRERHPIDVFFAALAEELGERAVGVVLSGGGSDGTVGVKAIKARGGFTMAQGGDGSAPRHEGMPSSAIATGLVDLVVPAGEIGARLAEFGHSLNLFEKLVSQNDRAADSARVKAAREAICGVLRDRLGHDFASYKEATFLRRVGRRMHVLQEWTLEGYIERLSKEPDEPALLFRDLLIGVTSFFRDADAFAALDRLVIGSLLESKGAADLIRIWIPACATGEEVYSIAILLRERMAKLEGAPKAQLFATDIDEAALAVARAGRYPAALLDSMSPERLERYFVEDAGGYKIAKDVRDMCVFSTHSVTRDPPFSRMDLISCRNLLIYLGGDMQGRLASVFHYALRPGGHLFLGSAENLTQHADLFEPVDRKHLIFRRRDVLASASLFPVAGPAAWLPSLPPAAPGQRRSARSGAPLRRLVETRVLERFSPAHVLIDREGEVLHYSARTGKYLEPAQGAPSRQLDDMARKGLRLELRGALKEAVATQRPAARERIAVEFDDRIHLVTLRVEPLREKEDSEPLFLVLFSDADPPLAPDEARKPEPDDVAGHLEGELRDMREQLQSKVEEYETALEELKSANEELVSVNEELQSTNEEFETSKEEIQSVNEELHTVNDELNGKVGALNRANDDLRNLFESTRIATVFLDRRLTIRSFTPAATAIFSLIPGDRGRPLTDIASKLHGVDLGREVARVLKTGEVAERQVGRTGEGAVYLMRTLPYRDESGAVEGAVVTFIDVTRLTEAEKGEQRQRAFVDELNHRVRNILAVVMSVVELTLMEGAPVGESRKVLVARLQALAKTQALISRENAVPLRELFEVELAPYLLEGRSRVELDGPEILLAPKPALSLGLAAHELATNAAKHGALSTPAGAIRVSWRREGERLEIEWRESGGPRPAGKGKQGFGSTLIERQIAYELDGQSAISLPPEGAVVRMSIPAARLLAPEPGAGQAAPPALKAAGSPLAAN